MAVTTLLALLAGCSGSVGDPLGSHEDCRAGGNCAGAGSSAPDGGGDGGPDGALGVDCTGLPDEDLSILFADLFAPDKATGCAAAGCHGTGAGEMTFRDAAEFWAVTVGVPAEGVPDRVRVVPGDPARSYLYGRLLPVAPVRMPLGGPYLTDGDLERIAGWICHGAQPPMETPAVDGGVDAGAPADGGSDAGGASVRIDSFSPTSGMVGTPVIIDGAGFSQLTDANLVRFGGVAATVLMASPTQLEVSVPVGAVTGKIDVTVAGVTAISASDFQVIVPNPLPGLTSIAPTTAVAGQGELSLTLTGTDFVPLSTAIVGGTNLVTTYVNATELQATVPATLLASAGTLTLTVTSPGPGGGTSGGKPLTVFNPVPVLGAISPSSAAVGSGPFPLTLTGSGFVIDSEVTLNGAPVSATWIGSTELRITVPSTLTNSPGSVQVAVTNAAPGGGTSSASTLSVTNPAPTLSSVAPTSVPVGSATFTLNVTGTGFVFGSVVRLDGSALPSTYLDGSHLTASVDAANAASATIYAVDVVTPAPGGGTSTPATLTVANPTPSLASISPPMVATNGASFTLTLIGSNFVAGSVVLLDGAPRATQVVSSSQLSAGILASDLTSVGSRSITVSNPGPGGGTSSAQTLSVADSSLPMITGVAPAPGTANTAFTLTISGSGYVCGAMSSTVLRNGAPLTVTDCTATVLQAAFTAVTPGLYDVQVQNPMAGGSSNVVSYSIVAPNPAPVLSGLLPSSVIAGGAAFTLDVQGSGFIAGSQVTVGGQSRTTSFVDATLLKVNVLASDVANAGSVTITVTSPGPGGGSSSLNLSVLAPNPVPQINGLSPTPVYVGSAPLTLTVLGTGFVATSEVRVGGVARVTTFDGLKPNELRATLVAGDLAAEGQLAITVVNPWPGGGTSNTYNLSVVQLNPVPQLAALQPASKPAGSPAFTLTVTGTGFVASSTVAYDGVPKTTTFVSSAQLDVAIASSDVANAGMFAVVVTSPAPGGGNSQALDFAVTNPAPSLTAITPGTVVVGSPTFSLNLAGTGFVGQSEVLVDGMPRTTSFVNSTQLTASIPASDLTSAGNLSISVRNPTPGGGESTTLVLSVVAAPNPVPTLAALSPCGKVAGAGAFVLTVTGSSFVSGAQVRFNGSALTTTFVSATELTAMVPASAIASAPAGNWLAVVVRNPTPGGGDSGSATFGVASQTSTLAGQVQPLFTSKCATMGCHVTGSGAPMSLEAGLAYANTVNVVSSACSPTLIVRQCAPTRAASVLVDKVLATVLSLPCSGSPMPKTGSLSASQKQVLVDWVAQGAPP